MSATSSALELQGHKTTSLAHKLQQTVNEVTRMRTSLYGESSGASGEVDSGGATGAGGSATGAGTVGSAGGCWKLRTCVPVVHVRACATKRASCPQAPGAPASSLSARLSSLESSACELASRLACKAEEGAVREAERRLANLGRQVSEPCCHVALEVHSRGAVA